MAMSLQMLHVLLNLAIIACMVASLVGLRRRRTLLREAGSVLWNMPETDDEWGEKRATEVMQRIDKEVVPEAHQPNCPWRMARQWLAMVERAAKAGQP